MYKITAIMLKDKDTTIQLLSSGNSLKELINNAILKEESWFKTEEYPVKNAPEDVYCEAVSYILRTKLA